GSLDISTVDPRVSRIMDIKCPGSGMAGKNLWSNIRHLRPADEVKFVIADKADFDWACATIAEHALTQRCPVLFSPVFGLLSPTELAGWVLASGLQARLQMQMHKLLWDPGTRGV
ncbi:MAG: 7-carboxy-7-deazaguanine synthase QueE, partial [Bacteroidetes bacterium]|nr:7-carboxy-7-deazaguanine synthase QueE [Bacteroidota bacterium]